MLYMYINDTLHMQSKAILPQTRVPFVPVFFPTKPDFLSQQWEMGFMSGQTQHHLFNIK